MKKNEEGKSIDETKYRGTIGSLYYLTSSQPDIMFSVSKCATFQSAPKEPYLIELKRIIRSLVGKSHLDYSTLKKKPFYSKVF